MAEVDLKAEERCLRLLPVCVCRCVFRLLGRLKRFWQRGQTCLRSLSPPSMSSMPSRSSALSPSSPSPSLSGMVASWEDSSRASPSPSGLSTSEPELWLSAKSPPFSVTEKCFRGTSDAGASKCDDGVINTESSAPPSSSSTDMASGPSLSHRPTPKSRPLTHSFCWSSSSIDEDMDEGEGNCAGRKQSPAVSCSSCMSETWFAEYSRPRDEAGREQVSY
jgi:hypothetical protein